MISSYFSLLRGLFSKPYSVLYIVSDSAGWVLDEEAKEFKRSVQKLGLKVFIVDRMMNISQVVHYTSQFALSQNIYKSKNKISIDYFHGKPELGESYKKCFDALALHHKEISRIRVSTKGMESLILSSGIDPSKVFRIHIGIHISQLPPQTLEKKKSARKVLGIPEDAFVIGSFQKDGIGWEEGNEPKLIKGPDIFLKTVSLLKKNIPNVWVLLSGPARGYIKNGLDTLGIPYKHTYVSKYEEMSGLYDTLDLYLITSREEGGPKACLESMSKGIPLVTTEVGQCKDLVIHGTNALMAAIEDAPGLAELCLKVTQDYGVRKIIVEGGLVTAQENSYEAQLPLWKDYFEGILNT
jgi:glycosyltransferase involved in cell wall biosynthesis